MLVLHVQEFIREYSFRECSLDSSDLNFLKKIKERFLLSDSATELSESEINWLKNCFFERWLGIRDTQKDYTFCPLSRENEWVSLAKHLGEETKEIFWRILMPSAINDVEPDGFLSLNKQSDPRDIYFGEDDLTWHSLHALFNRLENNPASLVVFTDAKQFKAHPLSLKELLRIRNKQPHEEATFGPYTSFWEFLTTEIVPKWEKGNKINANLLKLLHDSIEAHFQDEGKKKPLQLNDAFLLFSNHLKTQCTLEETTQFFATKIECNGKQFTMLDILLDCLHPAADISEKLLALIKWMYTTDRSLDVKNAKLLAIKQSPLTERFFDINSLATVMVNLPFKLSSGFKEKLESLRRNLVENIEFTYPLIEDIRSIFSTSWHGILESREEADVYAIRHATIWHYLMDRDATNWQISGTIPHHLLSDLLGLIELYYQQNIDSDKSVVLKQSLVRFFASLRACSLEDINYFYSTPIDYEGRKIPLLELLIDGLLAVRDVPTKLSAIANWIYQVDHSLVAEIKELEPVYKTHCAGPFFGIEQLRVGLNSLPAEGPLKVKLDDLKEVAATATTINASLIKQITNLYSLRIVIDKPQDYMRNREDPWVEFAKKLAGAKLIPANYYKLLMPSLTHDVDFITEEPVTKYPLSWYILTDNNKQLLFLPNCVQHHQSNATFYNCNSKPSRPLTPLEKQRVQAAAPQFAEYYKRVAANQTESPISIKTVQAVKELAENSVYAIGLILLEDYEPWQLASSYTAYKKFLAFRDKLPEDERKNLDEQQILLGSTQLTFLEVLEIILNKGECIAKYGKFFIKLVIDYCPEATFSKEVEHRADLDGMRLCSARKVYRDYEGLTREEAKRRLMILFVSLLTHPFAYIPYCGVSITMWDCSNTTTDTGNRVFQALEEMIASNNFEHVRFTYFSILKTIILPALNDNSLRTSMTRYADTIDWLKSIRSKSMYDPDNSLCFEPSQFLVVLPSFTEANPSLGPVINSFLDEIIQTLAQNVSPAKQWVRINVKFTEFVKSLNRGQAQKLLSLLRADNTPETHQWLIQSVSDCVIHRLAFRLASAASGSGNKFFRGNTAPSKTMHQSFLELLKEEFATREIEEDISIAELLKILRDVAKQVSGVFEQRSSTTYLDKFQINFARVDSSPNCSQQAVW